MNAVAQSYNWLLPSIHFEFIKERSVDDCATLLAKKANMGVGPFSQRLKVKVTAASEESYTFVVRLRSGGFFLTEAHGTTFAIADTYSQIEGSARTTPTLLGLLMFAILLIIFEIFVLRVIDALSGVALTFSAVLSIGALVIVFVAYIFMLIRSQTLGMAMYTDMLLGALLRSL